MVCLSGTASVHTYIHTYIHTKTTRFHVLKHFETMYAHTYIYTYIHHQTTCLGRDMETLYGLSEAAAVRKACGENVKVVSSIHFTLAACEQIPEEAKNMTYDGGAHWVSGVCVCVCVCVCVRMYT